MLVGGELGVDVGKVEVGDLLVKDLGQGVDADLELARVAELDELLGEGIVTGLVEVDLGKDLVGERAGHDK